MSDNINMLLVGTGYMGREYSKVLKEQERLFAAVCRNSSHAEQFEKEEEIRTYSGGVRKAINSLQYLPESAIVAVNVDQLVSVTMELIELGVNKILVEKPAGMNRTEIEMIDEYATQNEAEVFVAYNRRFYASTEKALQIIEQDGGVSSFNFEFTEWSFQIAESNHTLDIKEEWMLANSSHVIDLAFFLGGWPKEMTSYNSGSLSWHSRASQYAGAGITETGALFSYQANWDAPGRWGVEILTNESRLYFRPIEKLTIQKKGSVVIDEVPINDYLDTNFKPGLYNQVRAFIEDSSDARLLKLNEQVQHMKYYEHMEGLR